MSEKFLSLIEATLNEMLENWGATLPSVGSTKDNPSASLLAQAMREAVGSGGKRIRPLVCLASSLAVGGKPEDALYPAAAIELLHNYTLVHDDLPSMDNDTLRRGKPTIWTVYGEANAILVGDALQALAFRTAACAPRNVAEILAELGEKAVGVVAGQVADIAPSSLTPHPLSLIPYIYEHKTADLFIAAAKMGGLAGGGSPADVATLGDFARALGMAFQYEDDLLDGDSPYSKVETERLVRSHTDAATAALAKLPGDTSYLKELAERLVGRTV